MLGDSLGEQDIGEESQTSLRMRVTEMSCNVTENLGPNPSMTLILQGAA